MSELTKFARPYAKAAFELARDHNALGDWSAMLKMASQVSADPEVAELLDNPHVAQDKVAELMHTVGAQQFDETFNNLLVLMAHNRRLYLLPEVTAMYEHYRREEEKRLRVTVVSAAKLNDDQQNRLQQALARRFDRQVEMETRVDQSLLGGAVIYADDLVIDGSVRGRLEKLAVQLSN